MSPPPIIVAGAGIAGLAAALACKNHDCLILEQATAFSPVGAGLQLGPNAVRALQKLGAWDAVDPITSSPPAIYMRDGITGKTLKLLPLGQQFEKRYGAPYRVAHRADLHKALLACVSRQSNTEIRLAEKIKAVSTHIDHIALTAGESAMTCQSLIAADGVNSTIRKILFSQADAIDSGFAFHRALIPASNLNIPDIALECVNLWMYPKGHVVHYPLGKDRQLNLVAVTQTGQSVNAHFSECCRPLQNLLQFVPDWTQWSGLYASPLNRWTKGGLLLLGDAAHGTLPFLAQGAAMALEDAACLAQSLQSAHSINNAFTETAARRITRTTRLHKASLRAGNIYHAKTIMRHLRNATLVATPPSRMMAGLDWIYRGM